MARWGSCCCRPSRWEPLRRACRTRRRSLPASHAGRTTLGICARLGPRRKNPWRPSRALELQPADVATLVWLGNAYLEEDRAELAEPVFTKALAVQPQSGAAMSGLGRAALARREYAEAVRKLEAALALSPQASAIEYPLSLGYRGLGDAGKADAHLRRRGDKEPIPIDPRMDEVRGLLHSVVAYEKRGLRALDGGDYRAAIDPSARPDLRAG